MADTFFRLDELPEWIQLLGNLNPLRHCVELVRHAAFGWEGWSDVAAWERSSRSDWRCGGSRFTR